MQIKKSSRHSKIARDFGETLVLYWLSKHGFECAKVDHTGIDLIALNPHTKERMGISVKSRTRTEVSERDSVTIRAKEFDKIYDASKAFGCQPFFAMVVDAGETIRVFITSVAHALEMHPRSSAGMDWRMSPAHLAKYALDPDVMTFELQVRDGRWWQPAR